ncbi:MAG: hypothetical protein ABIP69_01080 [Ferruginibacter sp.]
MEINVPTSLKDISIRQFVEFEKSDKTNQDLVSIFCDIENTNLLQLKDFQEITEMVTEVLNTPPIFYKQFKYKGINYGFIPKLDNLSTAEFIDLEMYMGKQETFHKSMSILYRPIIKERSNWFKKSQPFYDIQKYEGANDLFIDAPVEYYLGACVFFFDLMNDLEKTMLAYSQIILNKAKEEKTNLTISGDGMLV